MEQQTYLRISNRETIYIIQNCVVALMLLTPCLASAQTSNTVSSFPYQSLERSGDWIVRSATIPFHKMEVHFYPNASGSGTFYENNPVKIYSKPRTAVLNTTCPSGYKKEGKYCFSCQSGYKRTIWDINSDKACEKDIFTSTRADVKTTESCGSTRNTYQDVNGTCYECPADFSVIALENSHGIRKCQKSYDSITSFDAVYTEQMLQSMFDVNQLECLQSGEECYVANVSTAGNYRYGRHCGPGFGGGEPIDILDAACQAHDAHRWEENVKEGEVNTDVEGFNCANEYGFKRTVERIIENYSNSNVPPAMIEAAKATVSELWFVRSTVCPEENFPETEPFDFFNSSYVEDN